MFLLYSNLENVDNIDKDDVENPQLVVEYVNEIYAYLRQLETIQGMIIQYQIEMIRSYIKVDIGSQQTE